MTNHNTDPTLDEMQTQLFIADQFCVSVDQDRTSIATIPTPSRRVTPWNLLVQKVGSLRSIRLTLLSFIYSNLHYYTKKTENIDQKYCFLQNMNVRRRYYVYLTLCDGLNFDRIYSLF